VERSRTAPIGATHAVGRLERKTWWLIYQTVWEGSLANDVAPVSSLVADDGRHVVTFDDWHGAGFGPNAVVVYGVDGHMIRQIALQELLPQDNIKRLPHSVSSIWWRRAACIDSSSHQLVLVFNVGPEGNSMAESKDVTCKTHKEGAGDRLESLTMVPAGATSGRVLIDDRRIQLETGEIK
jgi:hypothetical protein